MMKSQADFRPGKHAYTFLAVICGKKKIANDSPDSRSTKAERTRLFHDAETIGSVPSNADASDRDLLQKTIGSRPLQEYSDLVTSGQLEVHILDCATRDELEQNLVALEPEIVHFQGEQVPGTNEIGSLELSDCRISSPDTITRLFDSKIPELVYLETSSGSKLGEALHDKGVPYVIFWKSSITYPLAIHFRRALIAVLQSSSSQIWCAFELAKASFNLHCGHLKRQGAAISVSRSNTIGPVILGDAPPKMTEMFEARDSEAGDDSLTFSPTIKIYDDELDLPLLVCAETHANDSSILRELEDGLNALLAVEVNCLRLLHRVSASPPPSAAPLLTRGVVTMRCDVCTSSSARISLLVSGSAHICFDDQILEHTIKRELMQKGQLTYAFAAGGDNKPFQTQELRQSASMACGAPVVEIKFRTLGWAAQVLRQLAPAISFRSLVALGIAGVQGFPVAAFQRDDADRLLSLRSNSPRNDGTTSHYQPTLAFFNQLPSWLRSPLPSRESRKILSHDDATLSDRLNCTENAKTVLNGDNKGPLGCQSYKSAVVSCSKSSRSLVAAMKPVPHTNPNRKMPFSGAVLAGSHNGWMMKVNVPNGTSGKVMLPSTGAGPLALNSGCGSHSRKSLRASSPEKPFPLNSVPLKKHGCNRGTVHGCSEEQFLKDVMQFLISRGHTRLVPSTEPESFPDAVLNGKRLDLYNLYKEVVSRGGFHVGNGINWKGQVFSKMSNHTSINKMTGVGNTLKRHYETYLLEYELAHDDVSGECCILCHSSAAGDWVNCGICGEWAHFGCDKRNGLGAFKEYAKTDGLEYICPQCSTVNIQGAIGRKKFRSPMRGHP
eukprot:c28503_g2_i2 orf=261-2768(+)